MPSREEMRQLVESHARLDDVMDAAIWIRTNDREAWLVEVLPTMAHDEHPERPVCFNPGLDFRHPLNLILGNHADIVEAIHRDRELASAVACGEVLHGDHVGQELKTIARGVLHGAA